MENGAWIRNKESSYKDVHGYDVSSVEERSFKADVKIGDLIDVIENYGEPGRGSRSVGFVTGFNQRRSYESVMVARNHVLPLDEGPEEKNEENQIDINDIVYYRILERSALQNFTKSPSQKVL